MPHCHAYHKELLFIEEYINSFQKIMEFPPIKIGQIFTRKNVKIYEITRPWAAWETMFDHPGEKDFQQKLLDAISLHMKDHSTTLEEFYYNKLDYQWVTNRISKNNHLVCYFVVFFQESFRTQIDFTDEEIDLSKYATRRIRELLGRGPSKMTVSFFNQSAIIYRIHDVLPPEILAFASSTLANQRSIFDLLRNTLETILHESSEISPMPCHLLMQFNTDLNQVLALSTDDALL